VRFVGTAEEAAKVTSTISGPVALKAAAPDLVHKSDVGGVRIGLESPAAVTTAFLEMEAALGPRMGGAVVQPMVEEGGVETIVGVTHDPAFGPLVLFGAGGIDAELIHDDAARLTPLTDTDAHELVRSLRTSPRLFGYRNAPVMATDALEDLILRVAWLADEIPEVVELDCNPVIVSPQGATVVDAKLRIAPAVRGVPTDLRRLPDPR
jgi:acyl-CoA synthetase (NDP forming)